MRNEWIRQVGVALLYALVFAGLREVSFPYWVLASGFRLSALLLVPRRYWLALALGEMIPLGYRAIEYLPTFGWQWSLQVAVPHIALAMPIVMVCQDRWKLFPSRGNVRMGVLLLCALLISFLWTVLNLGALAAVKASPGYVIDYPDVIARWILGNDLGVLTVVPFVLVLREAMFRLPVRRWGRAALDSRLVLECTGWTLPALAFLVCIGRGAAGEELRQLARMAMFLPVVAVALRHGWRAVAIGGAAASVGVVLTMPGEPTADSLQAEVFICFAISSMLLLGERIATLNQRDERKQVDAQATLALAQRALYLGDHRLRVAAESVEQIRDSMRFYHHRLLRQLERMRPFADDRGYQRQEAVVQDQLFRLADRIHPMGWNGRSFPEVLRGGALARALDDARITFHSDLEGKELGQLDSTLHLALYRVLTEVVLNACEQRDVASVRVRIRGGAFQGQRWAVMRVETDHTGAVEAVNWSELLSCLSTMTAGIDDVQGQVAIFGGRTKERCLPNGRRVSMMLHDPGRRD